MLTIILDNGHGSNTPGKCSPDKSLLEYKWAREIVDMLIKELKALGFNAVKLVPEDIDISLKERVRRANQIYKDTNKQAILISVHCNAAGADGKWHTANGWSVFVSQNASKNSKRLAKDLYEQAEKRGLKGNRSVPKEKYWVQSLAMCRDTNCPAVLTENMFQDNKADV
nr:N-acetylmuramoyl-L-alanine amidase [Bacteroides intestinalis]